jgi:hypothetical protein
VVRYCYALILLGLISLIGCSHTPSNSELLLRSYSGMQQGEFKQAELDIQQSLKGFEASNIKVGQLRALIALGDLAVAQKSYGVAIERYTTAEQFAFEHRIGLEEVGLDLMKKQFSTMKLFFEKSGVNNDYYQHLAKRDIKRDKRYLEAYVTGLIKTKSAERVLAFAQDHATSNIGMEAHLQLFMRESDKVGISLSGDQFLTEFNYERLSAWFKGYLIIDKVATLRQGPSTNYQTVKELTQADPIFVVDQVDDWFRVVSGDHAGWIYSGEIRLVHNKNQEAKYTNAAQSIGEAAKVSLYSAAVKSVNPAAIHTYTFLYPYDRAAQEIKRSLIVTYRAKNDFNGYANAFILSGHEHDFGKALSLAKDENQLAYLVESFVTTADAKLMWEAKSQLAQLHRIKNTKEGFASAYGLVQAEADLIGLIKFYSTKNDLEQFLERYKGAPHPSAILQAKVKLADLYQQDNNFAGSYRAYELANRPVDARAALTKATNLEQKRKIEALLIRKVADPSSLALVAAKITNAYVTDKELSRWGFFAKYAFNAVTKVDGVLTVSLPASAPVRPATASYDVVIETRAEMPLSRQQKSSWVGTYDKEVTVNDTRKITITLSPPHYKTTTSVSLASLTSAFFERGSGGGYSAEWQTGNITITHKVLSVTQNPTAAASAKGQAQVVFERMNTLRSASGSRPIVVSSTREKSLALINQFAEIDTSRVEQSRRDRAAAMASAAEASNSRQNYNAASTTSSNSAQRTSSSTNVSSAKSTCTVQVKWPDGGSASGQRVVGEHRSGQTSPVYTNSSGNAVLNWNDTYQLKTIYVDGDNQGLSCAPGGTVVVRLR